MCAVPLKSNKSVLKYNIFFFSETFQKRVFFFFYSSERFMTNSKQNLIPILRLLDTEMLSWISINSIINPN